MPGASISLSVCKQRKRPTRAGGQAGVWGLGGLGFKTYRQQQLGLQSRVGTYPHPFPILFVFKTSDHYWPGFNSELVLDTTDHTSFKPDQVGSNPAFSLKISYGFLLVTRLWPFFSVVLFVGWVSIVACSACCFVGSVRSRLIYYPLMLLLAPPVKGSFQHSLCFFPCLPLAPFIFFSK
jgi:hypothetical protein